jgi:N-acetylmuramoyl-L-alanine amidase
MIALCIGHSRTINGRYDGGAFSPFLEKNERDFNLEVAALVARNLDRMGEDCRIISDYKGAGYSAAMRDVASQVRGIHASLAVELHFNASSPSANGHEWLHWHASPVGKKLAQVFHDCFAEDFPNIKSRGIKPLAAGSRGSEFVRLTHCPAILTEPFFGTNTKDCSQITATRVAESYTKAILKFIRTR